MWDNKGTIATGVVLTTFAANPEPFIDGATGIVTTTSEQVAKPISEEIAKSMSQSFPKWTLWLIGGVALFFVYRVFRSFRSATKIIGAVILFTVVGLGCTELWAASVDMVPLTASVAVPKWSWQIVWHVVLFVLMLVPVA